MSTKVAKLPAAAAPAREGLIERLAKTAGLDPKTFMATIRETVMPKGKNAPVVTNEQLAVFLSVAENYGLNPYTKEIFAFPAKGGGVVPVVSIDGWIKLMNQHREMDGLEFVDELDANAELIAVTARVYRKDRAKPTEVTEYMKECKRETDVWKQWPRRMLRHKATIQAARYAFGFSGLYDEDEAARMGAAPNYGTPIDVTPPSPPSPSNAKQVTHDAARDAEDMGSASSEADGPAEAAQEAAPEAARKAAAVTLDDFRAALAGAKSVRALDKVWGDFEEHMPDDEEAALWQDAYDRRAAEIG